MSAIDEIVTSKNARHILNRYIDPTYKESRIACSYFQVLGKCYDYLEEFIKDLPKESVINLSTWGLENWSDEYDLTIGQGMNYDEVRKLVREKRFHIVPLNEYNFEQYLTKQLDRECEIEQFVAPYKFRVVFFKDDHNENFSYKRAYRIIKERRPAHLCFDIVPGQRHSYIINSNKLIFKFVNPMTDQNGLHAGTFPNFLYRGNVFRDYIQIEAGGKGYPFNNVLTGTIPITKENIGEKLPIKEAALSTENKLYSIVSKYCGDEEF